MANFGQEISYEEGLREQEEAFRPVNPLTDPLLGLKVEESNVLAEQANADKPQLGDPATAWFDTGPVMMSNFDPNDLNDFEGEYARAYSDAKPQNLQEYIALGDMLIQRRPGMADYIKRRMQDMPAGRIKDDYQAKLQESAQKRQIQKEIEMAIYRKNALKAAGVPDKDDAKFETDKLKNIATQIANAEKVMASEYASAERKKATELRIGRLYAQLDKMGGLGAEIAPSYSAEVLSEEQQIAAGDEARRARQATNLPVAPEAAVPEQTAGPQQITDKAQYDQLPSGAEYIGPDGKLRRKR